MIKMRSILKELLFLERGFLPVKEARLNNSK
jgi:hypothetical protein